MFGVMIALVLVGAAAYLFYRGSTESGSPLLWLAGFACLFAAIAVPIAFAVRGGSDFQAEKARVLASGPRVEAQIADVRHFGNVELTPGWKIVAKGRNPVTGEEQTFIGPSIQKDPSRHMAGRTTVTIAVDPSDPSRGIMDVSFLPEEQTASWTICTSILPRSWQ